MNKQERQGKADTIVGRAKEAAGVVTGDESLECEGEKQQTRGKFRERLGSVRRKIADALNRVAGTINK